MLSKQDKWRNLLKASGLQGQHNEHVLSLDTHSFFPFRDWRSSFCDMKKIDGMQGERKRNVAWRPLPKPMLRRVCELATMHPYPKGANGNGNGKAHNSPDRSTDITLSDYRRILRSINAT